MNMQTLGQKFRTAALVNLHGLLDWSMEGKDVEMFEQYCRDLRASSDALDNEAAASRGRKSFLEQQIATAEARCTVADEQINILLGDDEPENDKLATPLQVQFDAAKKQIATWQNELVEVNQRVANYDQAVSRLNSRLVEAQGKLDALRSQTASTKANEKAAKALSGIDIGDTPDTSGVEARLAERSAVASNALNRSLDRVTSVVGGATAAEAAASAAIAERKRKLAAQKAPATA